MKKYALITGATGGLGRAFAVECALRGYNLFLTDVSFEKLTLLGESLKSTYGIKIIIFPCDLMKMTMRESLFKRVEGEKIAVFLTINVAGLDFEGCIEDLSSYKISKVLRVNTEATLDITRFSASQEHDGEFYIINVASMAGFYPMPLKALYSASKRCIISFSLAIREEIKHMKGHVLALCPAGLRTNEGVIKSIDSQGFIGRLTTMELGTVVNKTIEKAFRNKKQYVPGLINLFVVYLSKLIPDVIKARLIYGRWSATRKRIYKFKKVNTNTL